MDNIVDNFLIDNSLNTLLFSDPYAKLCFTSIMTSCFKKTIYLDLDTTFTAYANSGFIRNYTPKTIILVTPKEGELEFILDRIISNSITSSLIIIDSLNSFYNQYYKKIDKDYFKGISNVQHILSNFLMLLMKHCISIKIPILVTSMMRYKKKENWVRLPANRRFLQKKSDVIFYVDIFNENDLRVDIFAHPFLSTKNFVVKNHEISITYS